MSLLRLAFITVIWKKEHIANFTSGVAGEVGDVLRRKNTKLAWWL